MYLFLIQLYVQILANEGVETNIIQVCTASTLFYANIVEAVSIWHLLCSEHILNTIVVLPIRHILKFLCNNKMRGIRPNYTSVYFNFPMAFVSSTCSYNRPFDLIIYHFQEMLPIKSPFFHHRPTGITSQRQLTYVWKLCLMNLTWLLLLRVQHLYTCWKMWIGITR